MTEQEEVLHAIAIEEAIKELGIDKVMEIIRGLEERDLDVFYKNPDDSSDKGTT